MATPPNRPRIPEHIAEVLVRVFQRKVESALNTTTGDFDSDKKKDIEGYCKTLRDCINLIYKKDIPQNNGGVHDMDISRCYQQYYGCTPPQPPGDPNQCEETLWKCISGYTKN